MFKDGCIRAGPFRQEVYDLGGLTTINNYHIADKTIIHANK
jgi:hypothetical protein